MNFLIQNSLILQGQGYATVDLRVEQGCIAAIAPAGGLTPHPNETTIAGDERLLLPGFVNGHTHSAQVWQRGLIAQLPLELWLADLIDSTPTHLEQIYLGALSTAVDTLLSGGTCVMDHTYLVPSRERETVAALVKAYREVGIRAMIAPLIHDLPLVATLPLAGNLPQKPALYNAPDLLDLMADLVHQFHAPAEGIYIALGPTGFHRCSDALLEGCVALGDRHQLCCHTHLLETRAQKQLAQERYGGSAVQHLQQVGFLGPRTSLAHGVWVDAADQMTLAATGATVVHNPASNLRLGSGIAPVMGYLRSGVNVSLGCDGAASNDAQNLLEVIKLCTILHTVNEPDYRSWLTPTQTLTMASLGGARGVNLADQIGSLEVGKSADLVLYDLTHPSLQPCHDPAQILVLGRPTDVVDRVWVRGKPIVEQGRVLTVDMERLRQAMGDRQRRLQQSVFPTLGTIEPHYRDVMGLNQP